MIPSLEKRNEGRILPYHSLFDHYPYAASTCSENFSIRNGDEVAGISGTIVPSSGFHKTNEIASAIYSGPSTVIRRASRSSVSVIALRREFDTHGAGQITIKATTVCGKRL